jgi:hypothetical protein
MSASSQRGSLRTAKKYETPKRMFRENFVVSWIERSLQMVRLRNECDHDVCLGRKATRLRQYRASEQMRQRVQFLHLNLKMPRFRGTIVPMALRLTEAKNASTAAFLWRTLTFELIYCAAQIESHRKAHLDFAIGMPKKTGCTVCFSRLWVQTRPKLRLRC